MNEWQKSRLGPDFAAHVSKILIAQHGALADMHKALTHLAVDSMPFASEKVVGRCITDAGALIDESHRLLTER